VRMVRLMANHLIRHSKVKPHITHLAFDRLFHLSATLQRTVKSQVSTLASRAAWSTNRAMARWAILQQTRTHTRRMLKETHNMLNNHLRPTTATSDGELNAPFAACHW
jgi:hypothetical protein